MTGSFSGSLVSVLPQVARIASHVLYEKIFRPRPFSESDVPGSVESVTPQWLTAVMCRDVPGAEVIGCQFPKAHSATSVHQRIQIQYNTAGTEAGLPTVTFTKSTPDLFTRVCNGLSGTMADEALFYRRIRPLLDIEAPVGYHSAYDLKSLRSIHMLEDLAQAKAAFFNKVTTRFTKEQAQQVVDLLAALHAQTLERAGMPLLNSLFRTWPRWIMDGAKVARLESNIERAVADTARVIPTDITARRTEIWAAIRRSFEDHSRYPQTFLHSDPHPANWYVTKDGQMGLCDFQCVSIGMWARDVAYALSTMLTVEDRRAWERDLLARYLAKAPDNVTLGVDFEEAWRLYSRQMPCGMAMWGPNVIRPRFLPEMQPKELGVLIFSRIAHAMSDLNSLELLEG